MKVYNYEKKFGGYAMPSELKAILAQLSLEEQIEYFRVTESYTVSKTGFGSSRSGERVEKLGENEYVLGVICDGGMIVGAMIKNECGGASACFIGGCVCTYSTCDNNGAGYTEREDYLYLVARTV